MSALEWALVGLGGAVLLLALGLVYAGRAVLELADVLGHDHDTRWHRDDPTDPLAPHGHPPGLAGAGDPTRARWRRPGIGRR